MGIPLRLTILTLQAIKVTIKIITRKRKIFMKSLVVKRFKTRE
jgi:hypothetical protein